MRSLLAVFLLAGAGLLMSAMPAGAADSSAANEWQFEGRFYGWLPDINVGMANGGEIDISLSDILDSLQLTLMAGLEARKGKWLLDVDLIYLALEQDGGILKRIPFGFQDRHTLNVGLNANVEMTAWIVTPRVGYNLIDTEKGSLDVYAGARYLNIETDISLLTVVGPIVNSDQISESGTWWDGIVGVKGRVNLAPKWYLPYFLDGGAGDTKSVVNAFAGVAYQFKHVDAIAGYRYLEWNFKDSSPVGDLTVKGPLIGVTWVF